MFAVIYAEFAVTYDLPGTAIVHLVTTKVEIWPRGYKTFFMLNSAEHEIFSANKYKNANFSWHFHIY